MAFGFRTLALINLAVQVMLIILLSFAAFHAKRKKISTHCNLVRAGVIIQMAAIASVMLPSLLGYINIQHPDTLFFVELLFHHILGLILIGLWIYINLVYAKMVRWPACLKLIMRSAFVIWATALLIGLHIYARMYL